MEHQVFCLFQQSVDIVRQKLNPVFFLVAKHTSILIFLCGFAFLVEWIGVGIEVSVCYFFLFRGFFVILHRIVGRCFCSRFTVYVDSMFTFDFVVALYR